MLLYLVRHGDPDYENDCLTEKGRIQAAAVAKRIAAAQPDIICSSPMGRAIETARPACVLTKKELIILPWAHEISARTTFPDGVERTVANIPNVALRRKEYFELDYNHAFEAGGFCDSGIKEQHDELINCFRSFLEEQGFTEENGVYKVTRKNDDKIVIFCHGNMARSIMSYLIHVPVHLTWAGFGMSHTGVTVIKMSTDGDYCAPKCLIHSDLSHLYAERIPLVYNNMFLI